jgi:predicted RNA binding protein YcfA (HicA-like mRNA interferase family)
MPELPLISATTAIRTFGKFGWAEDRQVGSHRILVKSGYPAVLSVPERRELPRGTLRALIRTAGITVAEFDRALRS